MMWEAFALSCGMVPTPILPPKSIVLGMLASETFMQATFDVQPRVELQTSRATLSNAADVLDPAIASTVLPYTFAFPQLTIAAGDYIHLLWEEMADSQPVYEASREARPLVSRVWSFLERTPATTSDYLAPSQKAVEAATVLLCNWPDGVRMPQVVCSSEGEITMAWVKGRDSVEAIFDDGWLVWVSEIAGVVTGAEAKWSNEVPKPLLELVSIVS